MVVDPDRRIVLCRPLAIDISPLASPMRLSVPVLEDFRMPTAGARLPSWSSEREAVVGTNMQPRKSTA